MGPARPFPLDDTTAGPLADRAAPDDKPATAAVQAPAPSWPILARIAEIAENDELVTRSESTAGRSYRLDSPHAAAPPSHATPQPPARPFQRSGASTPNTVTATTERQERVLAAAPLPIRLTAQAWRLIQPYLGLIRFAAMLALMAIGGTSMTLMMGGSWHHADAPPSPRSTAVDQTSTLQAEPSAIEPKLPLDAPTPPDTKSSSIAPTAVGPAATESKAVMAIETTEAAAETATPLAETPPSPKPSEISDASATPYPTTSFPTVALPQIADEPWPQVQTSEPEVARLKGIVVETQAR